MLVVPLWAGLRTASLPAALACFFLATIALAGLIRAAFVYIAGFDLLFRIPWRGSSRRPWMSITFDDGPNGGHTREVLRLLDAYDAKATFFIVGRSAELEPEVVREIEARGHALGSHTYSHVKLNEVPVGVAAEEIDRGHAALLGTGVNETPLFRAPHGQKTFGVFRHLRRRGLRLIAWTAGVFDTDCGDPNVIARRARRWIRPGSILLLHDGKQGHVRFAMTKALEEILKTARERGLRLVTIPELLGP
jgi:peptidoglycan/xylan/chitin deacetylase (PgdA/CDA1 family)